MFEEPFPGKKFCTRLNDNGMTKWNWNDNVKIMFSTRKSILQ